MKTTSKLTAGLASFVLGSIVLFSGCESKGPAETTGEKIDNAIKDVKNDLDPAGPAEKAGRAVDKAIDAPK